VYVFSSWAMRAVGNAAQVANHNEFRMSSERLEDSSKKNQRSWMEQSYLTTDIVLKLLLVQD